MAIYGHGVIRVTQETMSNEDIVAAEEIDSVSDFIPGGRSVAGHVNVLAFHNREAETKGAKRCQPFHYNPL